MPNSHVIFSKSVFVLSLIFRIITSPETKKRGPVSAEQRSSQVLIFYMAQQGAATSKWPKTIPCWVHSSSEKDKDMRRERRRKASKQSQLKELFSGCSAEMRTRRYGSAFHSEPDKENQMTCMYVWQCRYKLYTVHILACKWALLQSYCSGSFLKQSYWIFRFSRASFHVSLLGLERMQSVPIPALSHTGQWKCHSITVLERRGEEEEAPRQWPAELWFMTGCGASKKKPRRELCFN